MQRGFTIVELMITVVVIAILTSVGYVTYTEQMARARRTAARSLVLEVMQHEERFYTENNTYTADLAAMGYGAELYTDRNSHRISLAAGPTGAIATSVAVTATAVIADDKCTTLTLTSGNAESGTGSQPAVCWR